MIYTVRKYPLQPFFTNYVNYIFPEDWEDATHRDWEYSEVYGIGDGGFTKGETCLEIGCATAYMGLYLSQFVEKLFGVDDLSAHPWTDNWMRRIHKYKEWQTGQFTLVPGNAAVLPFRDNFFDLVFTVSVLEHFVDNDASLCAQEIVRVLKPGGTFFGSVDFNPWSEYPRVEYPEDRVYTSESFIERIARYFKPTAIGEIGEFPNDFTGLLPLYFRLENDG